MPTLEEKRLMAKRKLALAKMQKSQAPAQQPERQSFLGALGETARGMTAPIAAGFAGAQRWSEDIYNPVDMWSGKTGKEAGAEYDRVKQAWTGEQSPRSLEQQKDIGGFLQRVGDLPMQGALAGVGLGTNPDSARMLMEQRDKAWKGAGDATLEATGSPALATGVEMLPVFGEMAFGGAGAGRLAAGKLGQRPTPDAPQQGVLAQPEQPPVAWRQGGKKAEMAEQIRAGSDSQELAKFKLPEGKALQSGKALEKDPDAKAAISQGWDKGVVQPVKQSNDVTKRKLGTMVDYLERAKDDKKWAMRNRPSDIAGDSLMDRVNTILKTNKGAGKAIGDVADTLKDKPVDSFPIIEQFRKDLSDQGVEIIQTEKGEFKPDFTYSTLGKGDQAPIREVIRQMSVRSGEGAPDAFTAHKMKQAIDNNVTYGKLKTGMTNAGAQVLKDFRRGLDDALDTTYPAYNEANTVFKETRGALDSLQDVARSLDLEGDSAHKFTGVLMRRIMGNPVSRVPLMDSIDLIESTAQKYLPYKPPLSGGRLAIEDINQITSKIDDDLMTQVLFADEIDKVFGPTARTSMEGLQARQADKIVAAVRQPSAAGMALDVAGKGIDKVMGRNDAKAIASIRRLIAPLGELSI